MPVHLFIKRVHKTSGVFMKQVLNYEWNYEWMYLRLTWKCAVRAQLGLKWLIWG